MIVFTASDSSEREEKNLDPAYWFDVPSSSLSSGVRGKDGTEKEGLGRRLRSPESEVFS